MTLGSRWERIARAGAGEEYAASYADRFRRLAVSGADVDGEAAFVASVLVAPARVLDAGCGTGRVAMRLAAQGYDVVGVDVDATMLAQARADAPEMTWVEADLSTLELPGEAGFDLVLLAGNVVPLLEPGTLDATAGAMAALLAPGGLLVAGFGLDADHLPGDCPVTPLADWLAALRRVGLAGVDRRAGWGAADPSYVPGGGYVVSVDRSL